MKYMVCGISDDIHTVLGFYGTLAAAMARVDEVKEEYNLLYDSVWYTQVQNGDCEIDLV